MLLVHSWGWEKRESFNGPSWSISVEILLYLVFFLTCRFDWRRWWQLALFAALGVLSVQLGWSRVGRGIFSFFCGGLTFLIFARLTHESRRVPRGLAVALTLAATSAAVFLMSTNSPVLYHVYKWIGGDHLLLRGKDYLGAAALVLSPYLLTGICFPALILGLALWQATQPALGRHFGWLGDISYACYLWHFPLLLGLFCLGVGSGEGVAFFNRGGLLAGFGVVLIGASLASYHWLERPAQARLRAVFFQRRQPQPSAST